MASQYVSSICCLLPSIHAILFSDSVSGFSRIDKKTALQTLEKKNDELTDMRDFGELQSLSWECSSVVATIHRVCYLYQENKENSKINEL